MGKTIMLIRKDGNHFQMRGNQFIMKMSIKILVRKSVVQMEVL